MIPPFRPLGAVLLCALALPLSAPPALADTALLLGTSRYDGGPAVRDARDLTRQEQRFETAGFDVIAGLDRDGEEMQELLSEVLDAGEDARIVLALSGHFVRSAGGQTWYLARDGIGADLATVSARGLPLASVLEIAAAAPGRAVVLLGSAERALRLGSGLEAGIGPLEPPQGVTVVTGAPDDIASFAGRALLEPGVSMAQMLDGQRGLSAIGFVSEAVAFIDPPADAPEPAAQASPDPEERALWAAAEEIATIGAFQAYLDAYPDGPAAEQARARIAALDDPVEQARAAEAGLILTRAQRRAIQADLTVLGYDTRGVDGIFGRGSRSAISAWQSENREAVTGYVDRAQVARIAAQADTRRAEIEAEEAREAAAREQADRAYWQAIGQGRDEPGLRSYLERYPDGVHADLARARLEDYEAEARAEEEAADRAAWARAEDRNTEGGYRDYLEAWPEGLFADTARDRLGLNAPAPDTANRAALEAREAALNLPMIMRQLIERRLSDMGYGRLRADGRFDADTRRAIAAYQDDIDLEATGYLDQGTMSRLMSDAVRVIIQ